MVSKVVEILEVPSITEIPKTPSYMLGVINLRGSILPVVDINLKFGLQAIEIDVNSCIIVLRVELDGEKVLIGVLVEAVEEVVPRRGNDARARRNDRRAAHRRDVHAAVG